MQSSTVLQWNARHPTKMANTAFDPKKALAIDLSGIDSPLYHQIPVGRTGLDTTAATYLARTANDYVP